MCRHTQKHTSLRYSVFPGFIQQGRKERKKEGRCLTISVLAADSNLEATARIAEPSCLFPCICTVCLCGYKYKDMCERRKSRLHLHVKYRASLYPVSNATHKRLLGAESETFRCLLCSLKSTQSVISNNTVFFLIDTFKSDVTRKVKQTPKAGI